MEVRGHDICYVVVNIFMLFSKPPTYIYTVMMTESDHKKGYQEYLKEKTFRTTYFAIKNKYVFIKYAVVIYVAMCC